MLGQLITEAALKKANDHWVNGNLGGYNAAMQRIRWLRGVQNLSPLSVAIDSHGLLYFASSDVEALSLARNANNSYQ